MYFKYCSTFYSTAEGDIGPVTEALLLYREAHQLIEDIHDARELGAIRKLRAQLRATELRVIDDLFLRKLPAGAADELADVLMSRHEKVSTLITSNRGLDDLAKLLGDMVIVAPLIDRLMHHGHLLKFDGKSWRLKEAAARIAKASVARVGEFDQATVGDF